MRKAAVVLMLLIFPILSLAATTTYLPNSANSKAWTGLDAGNPPNTLHPGIDDAGCGNTNTETEYSGAQKNTVSSDDASFVTKATSGGGCPEPMHRVTYQIAEAIGTITQIDVTGSGYGGCKPPGPPAPTFDWDMYIWADNNNSWQRMDNHTVGTKTAATGTISAGISNYISATDGNLHILTVGEGYCGADANAMLYFGQVVITYGAAPVIPQAPDMNIIEPDTPDWYAGNQTINLDLNIEDTDSNTLLIDINYIMRDVNYSVLDDLNSVDYCDSNNFFLPQTCTVEVTIPNVDANIQFIAYVIDDDANFAIAYAPFEFGIRSEKGTFRVNANMNLQGDLNVSPQRDTLADSWNVRSWQGWKREVQQITSIARRQLYMKFLTLPFYTYRFEWDDESRQRIGIMADEAPAFITNGESIDLYAFSMFIAVTLREFMIQATQQINDIQQKIDWIENNGWSGTCLPPKSVVVQKGIIIGCQ